MMFFSNSEDEDIIDIDSFSAIYKQTRAIRCVFKSRLGYRELSYTYNHERDEDFESIKLLIDSSE